VFGVEFLTVKPLSLQHYVTYILIGASMSGRALIITEGQEPETDAGHHCKKVECCDC
jgi:hypothetical protein